MKKLLLTLNGLLLAVTLPTTAFADDATKQSCTSLLSDTHCLQEITKNILTSEKSSWLIDSNILQLEKALALLKTLGIGVSNNNKSIY